MIQHIWNLKQCLSATTRVQLLPSLFSVSFLIFFLILRSERYFDRGLSNTQKAEKKYYQRKPFRLILLRTPCQVLPVPTAGSASTAPGDRLLCRQHTSL